WAGRTVRAAGTTWRSTTKATGAAREGRQPRSKRCPCCPYAAPERRSGHDRTRDDGRLMEYRGRVTCDELHGRARSAARELPSGGGHRHKDIPVATTDPNQETLRWYEVARLSVRWCTC